VCRRFRLNKESDTVTPNAKGPGADDVREALYNDGATGPAPAVQLPAESVTRLRGIMLDLDPGRLAPGNPLFPPDADPDRFHASVRPVLDRHRLARHAQVRATGTGLHLLVLLDPPAELRSAADQERWGHVVKVVQATLPVDPNQPGITALTRPVGAVNSKNGAAVRILYEGRAVTPDDVEAFVAELAAAPYKIPAEALLGTLRCEPCPVCRKEGSRLDVLDRVGTCYGGCGKVGLARLYDAVLRQPDAAADEDTPEPDEPVTAAAPPAGGRSRRRKRPHGPRRPGGPTP
jgi:hypothetical protein